MYFLSFGKAHCVIFWLRYFDLDSISTCKQFSGKEMSAYSPDLKDIRLVLKI